jgi:prevent-host-death family protein
MRAIGVRELRQHASRYLRAVEQGETIEVTDRGRPVALLIPMPSARPLDRLASTGRLDAATGDLLELGEPLTPLPGVPMPSEALADARVDER